MLSLSKTPEFSAWLKNLRDRRAASRIGIRIDRLRQGHAGDVKPVGEGVNEMRIDYGPGYRVYFLQRGQVAVLLLCGGDKSSQPRDIRKAKTLAKEWNDQWF
jgi:putative addiction module killer protein